MPKRIQRRRSKGWKIPENAVYVGRPTKFGNPYAIGETFSVAEEEGGAPIAFHVCSDAQEAVECFENYIGQEVCEDLVEDVRRELKGKDLACWCRLDQPCHADVLLKIANEGND